MEDHGGIGRFANDKHRKGVDCVLMMLTWQPFKSKGWSLKKVLVHSQIAMVGFGEGVQGREVLAHQGEWAFASLVGSGCGGSGGVLAMVMVVFMVVPLVVCVSMSVDTLKKNVVMKQMAAEGSVAQWTVYISNQDKTSVGEAYP